jgi:hypothetical protein
VSGFLFFGHQAVIFLIAVWSSELWMNPCVGRSDIDMHEWTFDGIETRTTAPDFLGDTIDEAGI